jgi:hypothetical protein
LSFDFSQVIPITSFFVLAVVFYHYFTGNIFPEVDNIFSWPWTSLPASRFQSLLKVVFEVIFLAISVINVEGKMFRHFFLWRVKFALTESGRGPMTIHKLLELLLFLSQILVQDQWWLSQRSVNWWLRKITWCVKLSII